MNEQNNNSVRVKFEFSMNGTFTENLTYSGKDYKVYENSINDLILVINQLFISEYTDSGTLTIENNKIIIHLHKNGKRTFSNTHIAFNCQKDIFEVLRELKYIQYLAV